MAVRSLGAGSPVRVVQEYLALDDPRIGVVYGSTDNQAVKVQAAMDMAAAAGGGTVLVAGRVRCGNTELAWPVSGGGRGAVWLKGIGAGAEYNESASSLYWDQDSPDPAPLPGDHAGTRFGIRIPSNSLIWRISGLCLQGPGDTAAIGDMPCKMYGVFVALRGSMENMTIVRWGAAVGIINDHQSYADCDFGGNGYGIDFMDNSLGGLGDMLFKRVFMSGQSRASIALSDSNAIANARFHGNGHFGAAPYGIYRYAGQETPRGQALVGVVFEDQSFEYCGNAMFYDEAGGGSWSNIEFSSPAEFATGGSAKWPGKPWPIAKIYIDSGEDFQWKVGNVIPQSDNPDQPLISAKDFTGFVIDDPRALLDAALVSAHKSLELRSGGAGAKYVNNMGGTADTPDGLMIGAIAASESILKGSLVEMVGTNQVRESRNGLSSQIVGVSAMDYAIGDVCVFVRAGFRSGLVVRNESGSTITNGALMTPDSSHQGCVKAAASLNDLIVGRAHDGSIATATTGPIMVSL